MPEELAIALIVLVVAGWIIVKILQGFAATVKEVQDSYTTAVARRRNERFTRKKNELSHSVRIAIPNQLETATRKLSLTETQFQQFRQNNTWSAEPPIWSKVEFQKYDASAKTATYGDMDIVDLRAILTTNSKTWSETESALLSADCRYPVQLPVNEYRRFKEFPKLALELEEAIFESDKAKISEKNIARYFGAERSRVRSYNHQRSDVLSKCDVLNKAIERWNITSKAEWAASAEKSKQLWEEEQVRFKHAADEYSRRCKEQKRYFGNLVEGYKSKKKDDVIERFNCILSALTLPLSIPHIWEIDFDEEQQILVVEIALPDVVHRVPFKRVSLKNGLVKKPLNQTEKKEIVPKIYPAILLRFAYEVFRGDTAEVIKLLGTL
jgi:hypothetical protein